MARAKFLTDCKLKAKPSAFGNPNKLTARITAILEQIFNVSFVSREMNVYKQHLQESGHDVFVWPLGLSMSLL